MNIDASVEGGGARGEGRDSAKNPSTDLTGKGRETIDNERRTTDGE